MPNYELKSTIPLYDSWDVIVAGGGPAGCIAATAAAREGAKTLLIEATDSLGGMSTSGLVPTWCPFSDGEKIIYRGLAERVLTQLKEQMPHVDSKKMNWVPIDPEALKRLYDDMLISAGASVLFQTTLCHVATQDGGMVTTVVAANKHGLTAYQAKVYVDCTGDADLVAFAGAEYMMGSENTGDLQPASHCFLLSNVDESAYGNGPWLNKKNPDSPVHKIVDSPKYPLVTDAHMCAALVGPGTVGFNAGHLYGVDSTDPLNTTQALVKGRKLASELAAGLAEFHPQAFGNAFLARTASLMGVRESRRIVGDYVLTLDDYLTRRSFDDEICRNNYYIDIHGEEDAPANWRYKKGESHGIPYRCLTPRGLTNVLVAGRSISCDRRVHGSVRVMPVCLAMGEAAGIAAALAATDESGDVHAIDVQRLRQKLRDEGVYLP